jgi:hypothetical protein
VTILSKTAVSSFKIIVNSSTAKFWIQSSFEKFWQIIKDDVSILNIKEMKKFLLGLHFMLNN